MNAHGFAIWMLSCRLFACRILPFIITFICLHIGICLAWLMLHARLIAIATGVDFFLFSSSVVVHGSTECPSFTVCTGNFAWPHEIGSQIYLNLHKNTHIHIHTRIISFTMPYQWHNIAYNCCNRFSYARIWLASKTLIVGVAFHKATRTYDANHRHFAHRAYATKHSYTPTKCCVYCIYAISNSFCIWEKK